MCNLIADFTISRPLFLSQSYMYLSLYLICNIKLQYLKRDVINLSFIVCVQLLNDTFFVSAKL